MDNSIDKQLQEFYKEEKLVGPSNDFTKNLFDKLDQEAKPFVYEPLISARNWTFIIFSFITILLVCSLSDYTEEISAVLPLFAIDWSFIPLVSKNITIALLAFCILLIVQFTVITKRIKSICY
jgi:hypothetical protein